MTPEFGNQWQSGSIAGFRAAVFLSAEEFLAAREIEDAKCVILDVRMLELQAYLETTGPRVPIIFATGYPDDAEQKKALVTLQWRFYTSLSAMMPCLRRCACIGRNRRFGKAHRSTFDSALTRSRFWILECTIREAG